jgi:hypothetical protein
MRFLDRKGFRNGLCHGGDKTPILDLGYGLLLSPIAKTASVLS